MGHHGGGGGGGGGFGGRRPSGGGRGSDGDRPRGPHGPGPGPHGPGPERPPDPGPADVEDVAEGPYRVVRPADMLVVDISLVNLHLEGHRLVPRHPGAPAFVLAVLPPQHVVEQSFPVGSGPPSGPVKAFTAGPTTLAFSVPTELNGLDLSLEALLDWERLLPLRVPTDVQVPDTPGSPIFRKVPRSVLEFPTRLLLTYDEQVGWLSRPMPHQANGRAALWHARLHGTQDGDVQLRAFAAVGDRGPLLLDGPLSPDNLEDLVTLTGPAELLPPGGPSINVPSAPLMSEQFIVTPLGASVHLHGAWAAPSPGDEPGYLRAGRRFPSLEAYDHITGLGRDQYVRVVTRGRLSTGHLASHVREFRRVFAASRHDGIVAYLRREDRIIVKQPEVSYEQERRYTHAGREMPFLSLRITDRVTPLIKQPSPNAQQPPDPNAPIRDNVAFWVQLLSDGSDYRFTLIGTDCEGRKVSFKMPLVFVPDGQLVDPQPPLPAHGEQPPLIDTETLLKRLYREKPSRTTCPLDGQVMAMARPPADAPGSTSHPVGDLTFGLGTFVRAADADKGRYMVGMPYVQEARVRVQAVEQFTGNAGDRAVVFDDTYLERTMEAHPAGAYLALLSPVTLALGAEKAGGVASPKTVLQLITAQAGVVPDVFKKDQDGTTVPGIDLTGMKAAFAGATLLGVVPLDQFLQDIPQDHHGTLQQLDDAQIEAILHDAKGLLPAPVLRVRDLVDGQGKELRYVWKTKLGERPEPQPGTVPLPVILDKATLTLDARTVRSQDAVNKATVQGTLTDFALDFFKIAQVHIDELTFRSGPGRKPDITASGLELKFEESLEFINTLRSALPADVFGSGAYVDVDEKGVRAGYKFALPALGIGIFTLSNVSLAAELDIPFNDAVSFRFSVAERKHPFTVTVSLLGGGGYFSMLVDTHGPQQIEGAIEFGGAAALNLGIASGGVSIMAGIRFMLGKEKIQEGDKVKEIDVVSLTGYLRCSGFLCVLGIVTVSVEFSLELMYEKHGHQSVVRGRGTLTVSVRIAFFSKSVTLELERSFSGAPGDPSFADCVPLEPYWREFCAAYAPQPHG
ncbi:hypothetical protein ACF1GT_17350 [Streptomyces sp. NPDC014636]|uniref:hypothetical protein n=1 Tax=Streptomyces sp. NPDC014636 TaxID=3364876 RepID=UPI0036F4E0F5